MLIQGGTVVTGDGKTMLPSGYVLVRDGRITAVGQGAVAIAEGEEVVDASGRLVIPGLINTHAHGCVGGPLNPVGQKALSGPEVRAQLDRHLLGGETTVLCVCGFCVAQETEATRDHPVRVRLATSHTPANFRAAAIVDGKGLTDRHRFATVEARLAEDAVAIGEIGAGHSLGGGGQDYLFIPRAVERATGVKLRADQARDLKWAVLGKKISADAFDATQTGECLRRLGLDGKLTVVAAKALIEESVLPSLKEALDGFEEAAALSAKTGARAILHTSPVSVGVIERLAMKYSGAKLVAAHANQSDFEPAEAVRWARRLRELGVVVDISTWDSPGKAIQARPTNFLAMVKADVVDTVSTDFAGGEWEPVSKGLAMAVNADASGLAAMVGRATGRPADLFPALADGRGLLAPGKVADLVLTDAADLGNVGAVLVGGRFVVREGSLVSASGLRDVRAA